MRVRLLSVWDEVRASYWFVPSLMAILALALSFVMIAVDSRLGRKVPMAVGLIWSGGAEGARELLSTVAGSMITVAGVTFSITMVAFAQASSQFGPRVLRNFMRDTGNQLVLGTFISAFVYCLMVLRTIRSDTNGGEVVPYLSVTLAVPFALAGLGVLIYFVHHASRSIQAPVLAAAVARDLLDASDELFPSGLGQGPSEGASPTPEADVPPELEEKGARIVSPRSGYVVVVDYDRLMALAVENDLVVRLLFRPGDFVNRGNLALSVWPPERMTRDLARRLEESFFVGDHRTSVQDIEFAMRQLVEMAVRALSPSINDPFTAITCLDWLGAVLARLAEREFPAPYRYDADSHLRVVLARPLTFAGLVDVALSQIRSYAAENVAVYVGLVETLTAVAPHVHRSEDRLALAHHANLIRQSGETDLREVGEREQISRLCDELLALLAELGGD